MQETNARSSKLRSTEDLNVRKVLEEFQRTENSTAHRKGTFKVDVPFEKALDAILKAKPEPKRKLSAK